MARWGDAIAVFSGFEGGDYGVMDPGRAHRANRQMFWGRNVIRYRSGHLGPRPGLRKIDLYSSQSSLPSGTLRYAGPVQIGPDDTTDPWFAFLFGTDMYLAENVDGSGDYGAHDGSSFVSGGSYGGTAPTTYARPVPVGGDFAVGTWIQVTGDGVYLVSHNASAGNANEWSGPQSNSPQGHCIGFYGLRVVASDSDNNDGDSRLHFSNAFPGWGTWGSSDWYDVGDAYGITTLSEWRDHLLIGKTSGQIFTITGTLGGTANLRRLGRGGAAFFEPRGLVTEADNYWFLSAMRAWPTSFNGSVFEDHGHVPLPRGADGVTGFPSNDNETATRRMFPLRWMGTDAWLLMTDGDEALQYSEDIFQYLDFPGHTFDDCWGFPHLPIAPDGDAASGSPSRSIVYATDDSAEESHFYWYKPGADRPASVSDESADPGDDSNTPVPAEIRTPWFWDRDGHEVRAVEVIVDLRAWDIGTGNARCDIEIHAHNREYAGSDRSPPSVSSDSATTLDVACSEFSESGTDIRLRQPLDPGYGGAAEIRLTNLQAVAVERIIVLPAGTRRQ